MSDKDDAETIFGRLTGWIDDIDSMDLQEMRKVRRIMADNVEVSERQFLAVLKDLKSGLARSEQAVDPISGLLAKAQERGLDAVALADKTGLSVVLITKLDRRLLAFKTIPARLFERLADALEATASAVADYLQQSQSLAMGARFRSEESPRVAEQQDFFEAVRKDKSISEDRRAALLALEASEEP
jgi:hypothetical protein